MTEPLALWTVCMKRQRMGVLWSLEALAVIIAALVLACPLGGMRDRAAKIEIAMLVAVVAAAAWKGVGE